MSCIVLGPKKLVYRTNKIPARNRACILVVEGRRQLPLPHLRHTFLQNVINMMKKISTVLWIDGEERTTLNSAQ